MYTRLHQSQSCSESAQHLWRTTDFYSLGHWCTEKQGYSVQKVYNICDKWFAVIGLNTDVQKSGGVLFRKCTIFVMTDWLFIGLDLENGGVLFKVTCVSCPAESVQYLWQCLAVIGLDAGGQKNGGVLFRKCTICVMNDLLSLAWTLMYRKVGLLAFQAVGSGWPTTMVWRITPTWCPSFHLVTLTSTAHSFKASSYSGRTSSSSRCVSWGFFDEQSMCSIFAAHTCMDPVSVLCFDLYYADGVLQLRQ